MFKKECKGSARTLYFSDPEYLQFKAILHKNKISISSQLDKTIKRFVTEYKIKNGIELDTIITEELLESL